MSLLLLSIGANLIFFDNSRNEKQNVKTYQNYKKQHDFKKEDAIHLLITNNHYSNVMVSRKLFFGKSIQIYLPTFPVLLNWQGTVSERNLYFY